MAGASRQRASDGADHQGSHACGILEAQLAFGGMHVHVQRLGRQIEEQRSHRMAAGRDHVAVGHPQRGFQYRIGHRAAVHHQALRRAGGPGDVGQAGEAAETQFAPCLVEQQQRRRCLGAEQGGDPGGAVLRRQVEGDAALGLAAEGDVRRGEGQAARGVFGVLGLGTWMLEELAPGGGGVEQVGDHDAGAERASRRRRAGDDTALHPGLRRRAPPLVRAR